MAATVQRLSNAPKLSESGGKYETTGSIISSARKITQVTV